MNFPNGPEDLRLGFVSGVPAFDSGDVWWSYPALGRLLDGLNARCRQLTVAVPSAERRGPSHSHRLGISRGDILRLPSMPSTIRGIAKGAACRRLIREVERRSDVVVVQLPFTAPTGLLDARTPRVYQFMGDVLGVVRAARSYYRGPKRLLSPLAGYAIDRLQRRLVRRPDVRVIANGEEIYNRYGRPPGRFLVSASLLRSEIGSVTRSRPRDGRFQVLYVGYLRAEKGLDVLVDAFQSVLEEIPTAELAIVGERGLSETGGTRALDAALRKLQDRDAIRLLGFKAFGPELFQCIADADVLVLPSRSEGTPRVLVEARAFGCPVVASRVGGVPSSVTHEEDGLLVPPGDAGELARAVLRLARDRDLRERLIRQGYRRAESNTIEAFTDCFLEEIAELLRTERPLAGPIGVRP